MTLTFLGHLAAPVRRLSLQASKAPMAKVLLQPALALLLRVVSGLALLKPKLCASLPLREWPLLFRHDCLDS
jgi:hypothetical protein